MSEADTVFFTPPVISEFIDFDIKNKINRQIETAMKGIEQEVALTLKINRLIDQRNALQKLIDVLDKERTRLEKPHLKGEKGNE